MNNPMTDDELLALARKVLETKSSPEAIGRALLALREATRPTDIIALIERHRAEVERLTARVAWLEGEALGNDALVKELETARKAEVERLTRERDEARKLIYVPGLWECAKCGCNLIVTEMHADTGAMRAGNDPQRCPNDCGPMWRKTERKAGNELVDRLDAEIAKREAAESALAAAQKRVTVLEKTLRDMRTKAIAAGRSPKKLRWLREDVLDLCSAALAGKEPGNGNETVRTDQQGEKR